MGSKVKSSAAGAECWMRGLWDVRLVMQFMRSMWSSPSSGTRCYTWRWRRITQCLQETAEDGIVACPIVVWSGTTTSTSFTWLHLLVVSSSSAKWLVTCDMFCRCPASINWLKCHWGCGRRRCGCRRGGCRRCCCGCRRGGCSCCACRRCRCRGCSCGCCGCRGLRRWKDRTTPGCLILRCIVGADAWQMSEHAMVTSAKVMSQSMKSTTFVSGAWCALPRGSALSIVLVLLIAHIRWVGTLRKQHRRRCNSTSFDVITYLRWLSLALLNGKTGTGEASNWPTAGFTQKTESIIPASQIRASSSKGFDDNSPNVR